MTLRTLADRLAEVRSERPARAVEPRPPVNDRSAGLARWFGARLAVDPSGATVVVERSVALPPGTASILSGLPGACYFDTETTGLSPGTGTVVFLAGLGFLGGGLPARDAAARGGRLGFGAALDGARCAGDALRGEDRGQRHLS